MSTSPSNLGLQFLTICRPISTSSSKPALSAGPVPRGFEIDICRIRNVVQPRPARRSGGVTDNPTTHVLGGGDRLKVGWVDAGVVPTKVIKGEIICNGANIVQIEATMGDGGALVRATQDAVTLRVQRAGPHPTFTLDDISYPIVDHGRGVVGGPMLDKSLVMLHTQAQDQSARTAVLPSNCTDLHWSHSRGQREVMPS
jgi:hypothetical protein